jgi:hypothetical protein
MLKFAATFCLAFFVLLGSAGSGSAQDSGCVEDSLKSNNNGEFLMMLSGNLFETLAGDSITAALWLPISSMTICGPRNFTHKGKNYSFYQIINTDDGEKVSALLINKGVNSNASGGGGCYEASIMKPSPFMGNDGEIFVLSDGSVWQVKYEYEYMYAYYPEAVVCPSSGYVIVEGTKLNAQQIK